MTKTSVPRKATGSTNSANSHSSHKTSDVVELEEQHGDTGPLLHALHGSSTASGYDRITNDPTIGESIRCERVESSEDFQLNGTQHYQGIVFHLKAWWQEIAWCLLTIGLLVALTVLLRFYENQPVPRWPNDLSLNAVVAVISTLCRAVTVIPISEGLSQLKWNAFGRIRRPLTDLHAFDQASRGPFGSLMLLIKTRGRLLGVSTLAALILVSGLATSSLTQVTISLAPPPERIVNDAIAKRTVDPLMNNSSTHGLLREAVYSTVLMREQDRQKLLNNQVEPRCPVGDCRWEPFSSLGVCVVMKNITTELDIRPTNLSEAGKYLLDDPPKLVSEDKLETYEISLREGPLRFLVYDANWIESLLSTAEWTDPRLKEPGGETEEFADAIIARHDFIFKSPIQKLQTYRGNQSPYGAAQVVWHWCVHQTEVGVSKGVPHTEVIEKTLNIKGSDTGNLTLLDAGGAEEFCFSPLSIWFDGLRGTPGDDTNAVLWALRDKMFSENVGADHSDPWQRLGRLSEDIALAMTTSLRFIEDDERGFVLGYARVGDMIVVVRWPWLSLLAGQVVLTIVFMVYVIVDTARAGISIVKSSNIAELMAIGKGKLGSKNVSTKNLLTRGIIAEVDESLSGKLVKEGNSWNLDVYSKDIPRKR